jgi:hypothetical protein
MDLSLVLKEIEISLIKVLEGGVTKSSTENHEGSIKTYMVGDVIRIDIKPKK